MQEASDDVEVDDEEKEFLIKSLHAVLLYTRGLGFKG
jgi:hypothetical protein